MTNIRSKARHEVSIFWINLLLRWTCSVGCHVALTCPGTFGFIVVGLYYSGLKVDHLSGSAKAESWSHSLGLNGLTTVPGILLADTGHSND